MTHFAIDNMKNDERRSVMLFLVCMISIELCSSMFNFGAKVSKGPTRIAVTGASGMVGQKLCTSLEARGNDVLKLSSGYKGDYSFTDSDMEALASADVVVHLAGENVASGDGFPSALTGAWSDSKKEKIMSSREKGTKSLVDAISGLKNKPKTFISASGVGYYGYNDFSTEFTEATKSPGDGFLAQVVDVWEAEALRAKALGIRTACLRFGVVLGPSGGALAKLSPLFSLGAGGNIGSGEQPFSWVSLDDTVRAIEFAIGSSKVSGPVNVCSPRPCTNAQFTRALGAALGRPTIFPVPEAVGKIVFGQMGQEMLFGGQRVLPAKLQGAGFEFAQVDIEDSMQAILNM
jgi:uncharacterized protein (TIGR01777 family)